MAKVKKSLAQPEIELLVHDILANDTLVLDKVRTLAVLRAKGYDNPERELGRIEAEFLTAPNLLIADQNFAKAMETQIVAAEGRVTAQLLAQRPHMPVVSR